MQETALQLVSYTSQAPEHSEGLAIFADGTIVAHTEKGWAEFGKDGKCTLSAYKAEPTSAYYAALNERLAKNEYEGCHAIPESTDTDHQTAFMALVGRLASKRVGDSL